MKLSKELYEKIEKLNLTDYEALYPKNPDIDFVYVPEDCMEAMLDDLLITIDKLNEKLEDIKENVRIEYV